MERKPRERKKVVRLQQVPIPAREFHFSLTPCQLTREAIMCPKIRNAKSINNEGQYGGNMGKAREVGPQCTKYQIEVTLTEDEAIKTFCQDVISAATFEVAIEEKLKLKPVDHVEITTRHEIDQFGRTHGAEDIALQEKENQDYSKEDKKQLREIEKTRDKENKKLQKFQEKTAREYIKMVNRKYKERNELNLREWKKQVKENKKKEKKEAKLVKKRLEREKKEMKLKEKRMTKEKKNTEKEEKKAVLGDANQTNGGIPTEDNGNHKFEIRFFDRLRNIFDFTNGKADQGN